MLKDVLSELFERDLRKLKEEIGLYSDEMDLWLVKAGISNSAGNLCLHLIGNLNHFIGAVLGQTGYIRDRDHEFAAKGVPRDVLLTRLDETIAVVKNVLQELPETHLEEDFPVEKRGQIVKTDHMLVHLFGHLSYHLGQVNYHRRLIG
ncbi:MAG: DUF1572 family protein [Lewinellaceae bacterium]|nr:DUF1572 family protein [Lewinellaceae bacterium]